MNRQIMLDFLKDQLFFTFTYFGGVTLVIVFYSLEVQGEREVVYPTLLASFIYLLFIGERAVRYWRYRQLLLSFQGGIGERKPYNNSFTCEQRRAIETISQLEHEALTKLDQLELRNNDKYKVISQIIHNIKTPTSVIDLLIQNSKQDGHPTLAVLEKINKENRLINENLNQVLSYLRLDYFQHDFSIEETNLVQELRDLINKKKDQFIYNGVFPQLEVAFDHVPILTDKKWNRFLLEQIISNAIKYTAIDDGDKVVTFRIQPGNSHTKLIIEDTGIGISPFDIKRVFEPFFTGENGRKTRNATGIGLYIAKKIADSLNHQLSITSVEGKGTTVVITYITKS